ncbi:MAG: peptide chain release factor N(5)-glutamine methyltransferase [Nitrosomonadales bacterium]|nr:peptide chain release factor N(5)-glutamine methyltransferase [Nitrosomonadales bacterium]
MPSSIAEILRNDSKQLEASLNLDSGSARIEVQCLLQAALQVNRAWLLTHSEQILNLEQQTHYTALFERRLHGEPVAYILGEREFYGLNFKVTPATLIPRPDTELLVELALQRIPQQSKCRVLDLGTGSGAIALSIAHARPNAEVVAVDASAAALKVAQLNAQRLGFNNVRLLLSDWFSALNGERFDIIVSNPPYIAANDVHLSQGDVRFEPHNALASGADGLEGIRRITEHAKEHLNVNGWLLLEHGYDQAAQVRACLQQIGFTSVFSALDLAGIERVSGGSCRTSANKPESGFIQP